MLVVPFGARVHETYSFGKDSSNTATSSPRYQILLYSEG